MPTISSTCGRWAFKVIPKAMVLDHSWAPEPPEDETAHLHHRRRHHGGGSADPGAQQAERHFGRRGHQGTSLRCTEDGDLARHRAGHRPSIAIYSRHRMGYLNLVVLCSLYTVNAYSILYSILVARCGVHQLGAGHDLARC